MSIEVQTTQNVTIDYEPAGMGYRMLAYIVDAAIIGLWYLFFIGVLLLFGGWNIFTTTSDMGTIIILLLISVPAIFYDLLFEMYNYGQTPGKMILKIRVINVDGTTPSFGGYFLRWLFRMVDFSLFYGVIAIISIAITKNSQRLGDVIARTTVVSLRLKETEQLDLMELEFHNDYAATYTDVLYRLSDGDMQTIRSIMDDPNTNEYFIGKLADRIKNITGYEYQGSDGVFLRKLISDYNFLALQQN